MAHVLIVDDEVNIRRVLAAMLKREGYEVPTAADGEQALAVLQKTPVHVVVTDLVMPRVGGMELLRRIAARTRRMFTSSSTMRTWATGSSSSTKRGGCASP